MHSTSLYALERHSFSDEAARRYVASHPEIIVQNVPTIDDIFDAALNRGELGLIPHENSSDGIVWAHLDRLSASSVHIVGEVRHQVRMCLGMPKQGVLSDMRYVYSHSKALGQCAEYLAARPGLTKHVTDSTVSAARHVAESGDPSHAALASASALQAHGLRVLATDIANLKGVNNVTQFFVVQKNGEGEFPDPEKKYHAAYVTPKETDREGVLADLLGIIARLRVNLTSIVSRNIGEKEYKFFLEMERRGTPKQMALLIEQLSCDDTLHPPQWLGSWDEKIRSSL